MHDSKRCMIVNELHLTIEMLFDPDTTVSFTNETRRYHDITELLLKMVTNTYCPSPGNKHLLPITRQQTLIAHHPATNTYCPSPV
jgi:hypothetical protein